MDTQNQVIKKNQFIETHPMIEFSIVGQIRASLALTVVALGLCGFGYSLAATGLGQMIFSDQANGSLIIKNHQVLGSSLVAQPFTQAVYFQPRPSASNYDPMSMSGSNMAVTNPALKQAIEARLNKISLDNQVEKSKIPADLVTASASGIDPEISVASAMIQVKRVANARHMSEQTLINLIKKNTIQPTLGILGQARVNVLLLNLALDQMGS